MPREFISFGDFGHLPWMKTTRLLVLAAVFATIVAAIFVAQSPKPPALTSAGWNVLPTSATPTVTEPIKLAPTPLPAERQPPPSTPPPAKRPSLPAESARLHDFSVLINRQQFAAQQRIDAYAAAAGDFKDVIPAQAKRYQEPEAVLTFIELLRDPNWTPIFLDYIQHRRGLEHIRERLHAAETSLGLDAGFSSARNGDELRALLRRAEPQFRHRSEEIAAKFQLDETVAADAREVAMCETLHTFVEAYQFWTINKNRDQ